MEGSRRRRKPPVEIERRFANSRLERQILVRVYELVVPLVRRSLADEQRGTAERETNDRENSARLKKGA
jgi:hypothetical protein